MTARPMFLVLAPLLTVCTAACGDVLFVELDVPQLCKTSTGAPVDAAPPNFNTTIGLDNEYALGDVLPQLPTNLADIDLRMQSVSVSAHDGISNFEFVDSLKLTISTPDDSLAPLELVDYQRDESTAQQSTMTLNTVPQDLSPFLKKPKFKISTELTGNMPTVSWSMDMQTCLSAKTRVHYGSAL